MQHDLTDFANDSDLPSIRKTTIEDFPLSIPESLAEQARIVAILDEAMGAAAWIRGHMVLAARLTANFRRPIPLGTVATLEAWVESADGRKVYTQARLTGASDRLLADGSGVFVMLDPERLAAIVPKHVQEAMLATGRDTLPS